MGGCDCSTSARGAVRRRCSRGTRRRSARWRFTPDVAHAASSADEAGQLIAWDVAQPRDRAAFPGTWEVGGLDVCARRAHAAPCRSRPAQALLWDLPGDQRARSAASRSGRRISSRSKTRRAGSRVSPSGRTLALTRGATERSTCSTPGPCDARGTVRALHGHALSIASAPTAAARQSGERARVTLWDAHTLAPAGELAGLQAGSQALAFSPDGTLLAAAEGELGTGRPPQPLRVWDVRTGRLTAFRARTWAGLIAFSPNGRLLAVAADERGTEIHDVATGHLVKHIGIGDFAGNGDFSRSVTFFPDGQRLFVGQYDGHGQLYSTQTWKPVGRVFEGHTEPHHVRAVLARRTHGGHGRGGGEGHPVGRDDAEADRLAARARARRLRVGRARRHTRVRDLDQRVLE